MAASLKSASVSANANDSASTPSTLIQSLNSSLLNAVTSTVSTVTSNSNAASAITTTNSNFPTTTNSAVNVTFTNFPNKLRSNFNSSLKYVGDQLLLNVSSTAASKSEITSQSSTLIPITTSTVATKLADVHPDDSGDLLFILIPILLIITLAFLSGFALMCMQRRQKVDRLRHRLIPIYTFTHDEDDEWGVLIDNDRNALARTQEIQAEQQQQQQQNQQQHQSKSQSQRKSLRFSRK